VVVLVFLSALLSLLQPQQMLIVEVDQLPQHGSGDIQADTLMVSADASIMSLAVAAFQLFSRHV
jgi:hypothetical protein